MRSGPSGSRRRALVDRVGPDSVRALLHDYGPVLTATPGALIAGKTNLTNYG